ncbi:MAG: C39 family peptidase [Patescibacteria group bacterium]|jgi:uncharacterized protein YvpB
MVKKIKKSHLLSLLVILFLLLAWIVFELSLEDPKGKVNVVKKVYYQAVRIIIPIKPAIKLAVPYHRQEHALSCEVASLLMALKYRGVNATESELIQQLPISDPAPRSKNNTWGDPNLGFVGNIDGRMPNTGYGVYEQPIYDLAAKYREAKIITNGTLTDLTTELGNNNPIVVWGVVVGRSKDISWKTPEGKIIIAQLDEHARTLIGFTGQSDNPELMILLDPLYGEVRLKVADFLKNWDLLEKKAVVIY